jgi:TolB-like protein
MKKFLPISVLFVALAGTLSAQELSLGEVIVRSARAVEEALPQGVMVAVLNFASTSETFSDYVIEELTGELVNGRKITIVDRRRLSLIREEMNLQLSGEVSDESAQAIGRLLGAQSIVSGNLTNMGTYYRFRVSVISVETATIQTQVSLNLRNDSQVAFLLRGSQASAPPVAPVPRQRPARETQPAQPPATPATPKEPAERRQPAQPSGKVADARDNWISAELGGFYSVGLGARYERMLNSKVSLGANVFWNFTLLGNSEITFNLLRIDASFRWYPWGKTFFVGAALGFHYQHDSIGYSYLLTEERPFIRADEGLIYGFAISPEIGWKIDVGNVGGFYLLFGITYPLVFGKVELFNAYVEFDGSSGVTELGNISRSGLLDGYTSKIVFLGMGYAF